MPLTLHTFQMCVPPPPTAATTFSLVPAVRRMERSHSSAALVAGLSFCRALAVGPARRPSRRSADADAGVARAKESGNAIDFYQPIGVFFFTARLPEKKISFHRQAV